jgi:2-hydroxy-3-keto-5-methylthiopentenyl-1-phosphate phosphatase
VLHKVLQSTSSPVHPFIFIGDGSNDQAAAKEADYVFAVRDSLLAKARRRENLPTMEFTDFAEVLAFVSDLLTLPRANS